MRSNQIVVLLGMSSSGKDSIAKILNMCGFNFVVSTTTRPTRFGEIEGDPYYFISCDKFMEMIDCGCFIEYRKYNTVLNGQQDTWLYGVTKGSIKEDQKYVVVLDLQGYLEFKAIFGDRVTSFYVDVEDNVREKRAQNRNSFCKLEWDRRLADDNKVFADVNEHIDFVVRNEYLNKCVGDILFKLHYEARG